MQSVSWSFLKRACGKASKDGTGEFTTEPPVASTMLKEEESMNLVDLRAFAPAFALEPIAKVTFPNGNERTVRLSENLMSPTSLRSKAKEMPARPVVCTETYGRIKAYVRLVMPDATDRDFDGLSAMDLNKLADFISEVTRRASANLQETSTAYQRVAIVVSRVSR